MLWVDKTHVKMSSSSNKQIRAEPEKVRWPYLKKIEKSDMIGKVVGTVGHLDGVSEYGNRSLYELLSEPKFFI